MKRVGIFLFSFLLLLINIFSINLQAADNYGSYYALEDVIMYTLGKTDDYQGARDKYCTDSQKYETQPSIQAGQVTQLDGTFGTKVNGESIVGKEFTIKMAYTPNLSSADCKQALRELGYSEAYINKLNYENIKTSTFEKSDMNNYFEIIVSIDKNGKAIVKVPDNFDKDSGLWKAVEFQYLEGGVEKSIDLNGLNPVYVNFGDKADGGTGGSSHSNSGVSITKSTTNYKNNASVVGKISNDKYQVTTAIPTSENLTYEVEADRALYDIDVTQYTVYSWANADITVSCTYTDKVWEVIGGHYETETYTTKDKNGKKVTKTRDVWVDDYGWVEKEFTASDTKKISLSTTPEHFYSVDKSNIYPLQFGVDNAINDAYILTSDKISLNGLSGPGSNSLNIIKSATTSSFSFYEGHLSKEAAHNLNAASRTGDVLSIMKGWYRPSNEVNYTFQELRVTTRSSNGRKPTVGKTSGSITKMIPSNFINGMYAGSAYASYSNRFVAGTCNHVVIHTPVVNNAWISVKDFENQKINTSNDVTYLILDGEFTIQIPISGTHNDYMGYRNKRLQFSDKVYQKGLLTGE